MKWNPIILGMLGGVYTTHNWIFIPLGILGFCLCRFRYTLAWLVVPINLIVSGFFLADFYENYTGINFLSPRLIPLTIFWMLFSIVLSLIGAYFNLHKSITKQQNLP